MVYFLTLDHDIIEKPIEEITLGTEEAEDIEFTVETLKSSNTSEAAIKKNLAKKVNMTYDVICGDAIVCMYMHGIFTYVSHVRPKSSF